MSAAIVLPAEVGVGKTREIETLLADPWRKLVCLRLRHGALLADHSAKVPITIHALLGKGLLRVGDEEYQLTLGVIVPVGAHVVHSVKADPELAMLVTFFRQSDVVTGAETTAQFD
jgi:quercetin dioxygenase-like cupin family protein